VATAAATIKCPTGTAVLACPGSTSPVTLIVARVAAGATLQEVAVGYGLTKQMISYINRRTTGRPIWFPQLDPDYVASEDYLA
jgi:hypothetical protein